MVRFRNILTLLGGLAWAAILVRAQSVTAHFEPEIISVGEVGTYVVAFENMKLSAMPGLNPPQTKGLRVLGVNPSTRQNTSIINGRVSSQVQLLWTVSAAEEGTFTVPEQSVMIGSQRFTVPAATLRVVPSNERDEGLFRFVWDVSDKTYYVGEAIPAFLKLYVRADLRSEPSNLNIPDADGIVTSPEQNPEVVREQIEGVTYNVVYWSRILTPIRPGTYPLEASIEMVYEDPASARRTRDFFFNRPSTIRKLLLAPTHELTVREVPTEGRPEGFNGAVGNFESSAQLGAKTVSAGEPVTLRLTLQGSGSFDRIAPPEIPDSPSWRVYPPKVSFEPSDALGFKGKKTFEYLLIPADESVEATPPIAFAAFDPYAETFTDLSIEAQPITVTPAVDGGSAVSFAQNPAPTESSPLARPANTWRAFRADLGTLQDGVQPVVRRPVFWIVQGVLALVALLWGFLRWRRQRLADDEFYARRVSASKTVRKWLKEAETAASAGQADVFFAAAQRTVQEAVGRSFPRSRKAESLTLAEIEIELEKQNLPPERRAEVASLFHAGDALRYAGLAADAATLREHHRKLEDIVRSLR